MKPGTILIVAAGLCCAQPVLEEIRIDRHLATPMRDGVKLYGDLYRPKGEGKFPVLICGTESQVPVVAREISACCGNV